MKNPRTLTAILTVLLLATLLVSGCGTILVPKNGEVETGKTETRHYDFSDFTHVDIGSAFRYEIKQSETYSVSITANSNLLDDIRVAKEGETLIIEREFPGVAWGIFNVDSAINVVITMPRLQVLDSSGATRGIVSDFASTENLDIKASGSSKVELANISAGDAVFHVSGASKVTGDIEAENIGFKISGSSTVQLKGSAERITTDTSGASRLKLADLKVENANIKLSGSSNGIINLDGKLDAELSGASTLEYIGEPTLGTMDITGSSKLKRK